MKITTPVSEIDTRLSSTHVLVTKPDYDEKSGNFVCIITSLQGMEDNERFFYLEEEDGKKMVTGEGYIYSLGNREEIKNISTIELIKLIEKNRDRGIGYIRQDIKDWKEEYKHQSCVYRNHEGRLVK